MKINIIKKISIILIIISIFNFTQGNMSYAESWGGKLLDPILDLAVSIGDGAVHFLQKICLDQDDPLITIERGGNWWSKVLGFTAAGLFVVGSVVLAVITAGGSIVVQILAGGIALITSISGATITYLSVKEITASMLPETYYLPVFEITPEEIFTNKIALFDVNFFNPKINTDGAIKSTAAELQSIISGWYYILRNIALVGMMSILVYLGIKILIGSVTNKAKYKEMITDWLVAICLLFVLHYVMVFAITMVEKLTDLFSVVLEEKRPEYIMIQDDKTYDYFNKIDEKYKDSGMVYIDEQGNKTVRWTVDNFMAQARLNLQYLNEENKATIDRVPWSIVYLVLVLFTYIFTFQYLKRVVYIAFLILISPLVVLTYPIDKANDGTAQGFNMWIKEFIFNLLLQPVHLLIYTIFIGSAMALASKNTIYVIVILGFMIPAEKILRNMFGFSKAQTPGMFASPAGAAIAFSGMKKLFGIGNKNMNNEKSSNNENEKEKIKLPRMEEVNPYDNLIENNDNENNRNIIEKMDNSEIKKQNIVNTNKNKFNTKDLSQNNDIVGQNKKISNRKNKPKLELKKRLKGAVKHWSYAKGAKIRQRGKNAIKNIPRHTIGAAGALVAGTLGLTLGIASGDPNKVLQYTGVAATGGYNLSNGIPDKLFDIASVDGTIEAFNKNGYGDSYKEYQLQEAIEKSKKDYKIREELENKLGLSAKASIQIIENIFPEYYRKGITNIEDIIIGEKLKRDGIVNENNTDEAISVISLGNIIGKDTRYLTKKQREEWEDTFNKNINSSKRLEIAKKYDKEIERISKDRNKENKKEEIKRIEKMKNEKIEEVNSNINNKIFEKLNAFSQYKY